jgi:hypothetical protein
MPWTEKQLRLFRAAAHNPDIAKRTGIKQSDAERMSKEGLKKAKGGILKQDTRHGKMDMPFAKLGRFAGMKEGGLMKKRRFDEGGGIDRDENPEAQEVERKYFASGVSAKDREYTPSKLTAKPAAKSASVDSYDRKEMRERPKSDDTSAVTARTAKSMGFRRDMPSAEQKERNVRELAKEAGLAALGGGAGAVARGAYKVGKAAQAAREAATRYAETPAIRAMSKANEAKFAARRSKDREVFDEMARGEGYGFKKGGLMRSKKDIGKDQMDMAPYKKGGSMESKAMMKKEISFMKRKGAPKSMIKHEQAEAKGYKKGGSIKETMGPRNMSQDVERGSNTKLKHGEHGIQKRGHTRGMEEKMKGGPKKFAAGGHVRAHGEHSIQLKGHTRGKVV